MQYPYKDLENFTLPSLLDRSIKLYKNEPLSAIVGQTAMSYGEFMQKVQLSIELLRANGISKGDKVVLLSENMPNWGAAYFGATYFGAIIVPILTEFHPSDINSIIKHSEAKAAFVSDKNLSVIESCKDTDIKLVINLNKLEIIEHLSDNSYINQEKDKQTKLSKPDEDDMAAIIYTSGTTENSKGVMLTHKNLVTNALSSYSKVKVLPSDVFLSILPLAHTFECTVGLIIPILHGSSINYLDKLPTPSVLLDAFKTVKPTMILTVPIIIEKIYKKRVLENINNCIIRKNLYKISFLRKLINQFAGKKIIESFGGRMRFFAIGGAPLSPYVEEFLIEAKFPYVVGYGTTETSPLIAAATLGQKPRFKSTGTAMAGVELKIRNKDPKTGEGEICVKSPSIMIGYYKDQEKTDEVMEDGWFLTGDLGYIDKDGFLFINGRSKNLILGSSGENIYPEQIESIINKNAAVLDSLVMQKNNKLVAMICLDYETFDINKVKNIDDFLEKMRQDVNSQLSSFSKITKFIEQKEPFIKTPTKKIKRYLYANK
ncbi:MAG: AMP-binding protein [Sulfurimonas sp.]|nr:AMP-binding protein [Sulfurimonas sp.]